MHDLIEALTLLMKYVGNQTFPTHCEHDVMYINCEPEVIQTVSEEDIQILADLGFIWSDDMECFCSYMFGSC